MPSRADQLCVPEEISERAAWLDENFEELLRGVPLDHDGWAGVERLERTLFPKLAADFLGGHLDPACPACGIETDEGTVELVGDLWRVSYQCGDVFDMTAAELRARVRHAGQR